MVNTEKIRLLKNQKAFIKGDIVVYTLLFAVILSLFWVFRFSVKNVALQGLEVYYEDRSAGEVLLFSYDYAAEKYMVNELYKDRIHTEHTQDGYIVRIDNGSGGYNLLHILRKGEAFIADANCSSSKDCVSFEHISRSNMAIICVPHHLKVLGTGSLGTAPENDPVIG